MIRIAAWMLALQILAEPFSVAAESSGTSGTQLSQTAGTAASGAQAGTPVQNGTDSVASGAQADTSVQNTMGTAASGVQAGTPGQGSAGSAAAEAETGASSLAGLRFDMNGDGVTSEADYDLTASWLQNYSTSISGQGKNVVLNGNNEAADSLAKLIRQEVGVKQTIAYGTDVSSVKRYCINNLGLGTPAGNQNPYGTCWAFAENAAVESAILREKTGDSGSRILSAATGSPKLWELSSEELLSAGYLAERTYELQDSGSQKGEGLTTVGAGMQDRYNAGGFLTMADVVYGNWDGPVSEKVLSYADLTAALSEGKTQTVAKAPASSLEGHLQDYYYYESPAVTREDASAQLRVWESYDPAATTAWKQAIVRYGALAAMISSDLETPDASGTTKSFNYNTWMQYNRNQNVVHDHSVTIVGWDDTIKASAFSDDPDSQPPGDGAWLVKNSWGSYADSENKYGKNWLQKTLGRAQTGSKAWYLNQISYNYGIPDEEGHGSGYFWLSYYDRSMAGAAAAAKVDIPEDGYQYDHNYTYQYAVSLTNYPLVLPAENSKTKVCNSFVAEGNELLRAVSAEPPVPGCTVEISVYRIPDERGESSQNASKKNKEWDPSLLDRLTPVSAKTVTLAEAGLHTVSLDTPVALSKGQRFAVVEKITSRSETTGKTISWLNLETAVTPKLQTAANYGGNHTAVTANENETWAFVEKEQGSFSWVTPNELNQSASGKVFSYGNARIHAYTCDR